MSAKKVVYVDIAMQDFHSYVSNEPPRFQQGSVIVIVKFVDFYPQVTVLKDWKVVDARAQLTV